MKYRYPYRSLSLTAEKICSFNHFQSFWKEGLVSAKYRKFSNMTKTVKTSLWKSCSAGSSCRNQVDGFPRATIAASPTSLSESIWRVGVVEIRDVPQGLSWTGFQKSHLLSTLAHFWFGPSNSWTSSSESRACRNKRRPPKVSVGTHTKNSRHHSLPALFWGMPSNSRTSPSERRVYRDKIRFLRSLLDRVPRIPPSVPTCSSQPRAE